MKLAVLARAKINLAIDVLHRQEDGYHQVRMLLQSISLADRLFFDPRERDIRLSCSSNLLDPGENLVYKAALALKNHKPSGRRRGVHIHLEKNIPLEAGLGGGSSDAAATLVALNQLWGMNLPLKDLQEIGFSLGADIPFCLTGGTALVEGLGERISPLPPFPWGPLVLVKPPFGLSTAGVYGSLPLAKIKERPDFGSLMGAVKAGKAEEALGHMVNVLEEGTGGKRKEILALKEALEEAGALKALMSGSGSVVFGFFRGTTEAAEAAKLFRSRGFWSENVTVSPAGVELKAL